MTLKVAERAYEVIAELRPLMPRIRRADRSLADQLVRAANSMVLNIGEAQYSDPGNRRARFFTAAGSANETRAALRLAVAWGHVSLQQIESARKLLDECWPCSGNSLGSQQCSRGEMALTDTPEEAIVWRPLTFQSFDVFFVTHWEAIAAEAAYL